MSNDELRKLIQESEKAQGNVALALGEQISDVAFNIENAIEVFVFTKEEKEYLQSILNTILGKLEPPKSQDISNDELCKE